MTHREKLKDLLTKGLIGAVIGIILGIAIATTDSPFEFWPIVLMAVLCIGLPYAWDIFGRVFYAILIGSLPVILTGFVIRAVASLLLGWVIFPIALIWNFIMAKREERNGSDI